jgi:UDP-N-acetylglucosamine 4-epimerase
LHQAALGSVPRSISKPLDSHASNVNGFVNMLVAARDARVPRLVFASSSSVYGDHPTLPKREERIGDCLSPYALTKRINELYAAVFARCYGLEYVGLRYFNVFGPRQDPNGAYAAVIPRWIAAMIGGRAVDIFGDGKTSRDFCYVANVVQANLLAATTSNPKAVNQVYNVAVQAATNLNELFAALRDGLMPHFPHLKDYRPRYQDFRAGDIRHSKAAIGKAQRLLGYEPSHRFMEGISATVEWFYAASQKSTGSRTGRRR